MFFKFAFLAFILSVVGSKIRAQGMNLGKLHWCDTLCLCHDDTMEQKHCFEEQDLYSLLEVEPRIVQRLNRANFKIVEKLMWCSETCLCHKSGQKNFKCTDNVVLGNFIKEKSPLLYPYLEPEVEVYDIRDLVDREDEEILGRNETRRDRHDKKKNRKHRKNRKKNTKDSMEITEEPQNPESSPATIATDIQVTEPENRGIHGTHVLPTQITDLDDLRSASPPTDDRKNSPLKDKQVNLINSVELQGIRENVNQIKTHVHFNQHILFVTLVLAVLAIIGVLILVIYICCSRRRSKKVLRSSSPRQEGNSETKVHLNQNW